MKLLVGIFLAISVANVVYGGLSGSLPGAYRHPGILITPHFQFVHTQRIFLIFSLTDHPEKCFDRETNEEYAFGVHTPIGKCVRLTCLENYAMEVAT